ncbi:unnamed protein product [Lampetra planeri]
MCSALTSGSAIIRSKSPEAILALFEPHLTERQKLELTTMDEIWYFTLDNGEEETLRGGIRNHGYDDQEHNYIPVKHEHFNYRFELGRKIGQGGQGVVVQCLDHKTQTLVALKILASPTHFTDEAHQMMELRMSMELQTVRSDVDYNVANVMDIFHFRGHKCIVMEVLKGIVRFLAYTKLRGIVHGDIKPVVLGYPATCAADMWSLGCTVAKLAIRKELFISDMDKDHVACCIETLSEGLTGLPGRVSLEVFLWTTCCRDVGRSLDTTARATADRATATAGSATTTARATANTTSWATPISDSVKDTAHRLNFIINKPTATTAGTVQASGAAGPRVEPEEKPLASSSSSSSSTFSTSSLINTSGEKMEDDEDKDKDKDGNEKDKDGNEEDKDGNKDNDGNEDRDKNNKTGEWGRLQMADSSLLALRRKENVLLKNNSSSVVRVTDFGFSFFVDQQPSLIGGTLAYMAPEVVLSNPTTCAVDMWSLNCTVAKLAIRKELFVSDMDIDHVACCIESEQLSVRHQEEDQFTFLLLLLLTVLQAARLRVLAAAGASGGTATTTTTTTKLGQ